MSYEYSRLAVTVRAAARSSAALALLTVAAVPARADGIIKIIDRKFPTGLFCPLESRATAGANLTFVATATSMRITFSANNFLGADWNELHLDNISVTTKATFDAHLVNPIVGTGFEFCYDPTPPPGQSTGGVRNAPSYDFNAAGSTELLLDLFASNVSGWTGAHLTFDATKTAPTSPASDTGFTGGSLSLGASADGAVAVSASKTVTGLTIGQQYVIFGWWYIDNTDRLTIRIDNPCQDPDGDGRVVCNGCDLQAGQICGDCNEGNPHCYSNCQDNDHDGWCVTTDCDENSPTCNANCTADTDADGTPDCRDSCLDADRDGYGTAGGAGNTCLGSDCNGTNPYCNVSCVDNDGDGRCAPGDCNDSDGSIGTDLPEVNDCADQQCPGNYGYGVFDETSGNSGFVTPGNKGLYSWPTQSGATSYQAVRASSPTFTTGCVSTTTTGHEWTNVPNPPPGSAYYFLNRPLGPCRGSWGQKSSGQERLAVCGIEGACGNGLDDDGDGATDCNDADCANTRQCRVWTFIFNDSTGNDIADNALAQFFQTTPASATDYICFELFEPTTPFRLVSWCAQNAAFYKTNYLALASTSGSVTSGSWNKWRKAPITGNAWQGPDTAGHLNQFGDDCFGPYSWCSEQFPTEPKNAIFPDRTNDCEAYDLATGACGISSGTTWSLTIRISATHLAACGF